MPYYSIQALSAISSKRLASSDMVEIGYKTDDPVLCRSTLEVLLEVFIRRYRDIKVAETSDVVAYFQKELKNAKDQLDQSEYKLKMFREQGRILNYYEQTKAIAVKKEDITDTYRQSLAGATASKQIIQDLEKN
ncbi:MAG: hypothetical protein HC880_08620 [Bacteroidia bacterium]|nr:hypothetical protein [Bacteroidia bacterium]